MRADLARTLSELRRCVRASACVAVIWLSLPAGAAEISLEERLNELRQAYPGHIMSMNGTTLTMSDRAQMHIDDGEQRKSFNDKLEHADVEDMLSQVYPVITCVQPGSRPALDFDPGRIRNEAFFKAIYGKSAAEVTANLVQVDWFGQPLSVNKQLGIDKKLSAVVEELKPKLATLRSYLLPSAGTFNWRPIAGTSRLSTHSYGIAIDISTAKSDYWRWSKGAPKNVGAPTHKIPGEIVAAFERQGFIWGGNWYHYDTMHFEYRPELVAIGRLAEKRGCVQ
ncbi:MAG: M15 family metallopeptidase [Hyphomicrobium sp.]|jgi:hypothetical protein